VPDPLSEGAKCKVQQWSSYGGYIYSYPSRFDFVFWPNTDANSIWYCEQSGFMAFMSGFDQVGEAEKPRIYNYINEHSFNPDDLLSKLAYLEGLYAVRDLNDEYRNILLRIFARYHQEAGFYEEANEYRKKALRQIESDLEKELRPELTAEYLYLAANYHRQFGDLPLSDEYLLRLDQQLELIKSDALQDFKKYITELAPLSSLITPGGALEPSHELIKEFERNRRVESGEQL
jgi:hypothetical protein